MHEYSKFPPAHSLKFVLRNKPKSAFLFIKIYENIDSNSTIVSVKKKDIENEYLMSKTLFKNDLLQLQKLGVILAYEFDQSYNIKLTEHNDKQL